MKRSSEIIVEVPRLKVRKRISRESTTRCATQIHTDKRVRNKYKRHPRDYINDIDS